MKVAIVGNGWVGQAMQDLFPDAFTYVRDLNKAIGKGEILEDLNYTEKKDVINEADVAFVCVPTPNEIVNGREDKLDTSIVEECISWLKTPLIVVRSTVNPGDCDKWQRKYNKAIVMQPEYLGETPQHPLLDVTEAPFLVIGGDEAPRRVLIELYQTVYNASVKIRQVSLIEAEIIKLSENRAIAYKVAQCQELYDVCLLAGVDYYTVREAVYGDDPRFNLWWSFVFPDKRGFDSKCIPKDVYAWAAWAESLGYNPHITRMMLSKNKEWLALNEHNGK